MLPTCIVNERGATVLNGFAAQAELQNCALERAGEVERVDHRSLDKRCEKAAAEREGREIEDEPEKDRWVEGEHEIDRELDRDCGLNH